MAEWRQRADFCQIWGYIKGRRERNRSHFSVDSAEVGPLPVWPNCSPESKVLFPCSKPLVCKLLLVCKAPFLSSKSMRLLFISPLVLSCGPPAPSWPSPPWSPRSALTSSGDITPRLCLQSAGKGQHGWREQRGSKASRSR